MPPEPTCSTGDRSGGAVRRRRRGPAPHVGAGDRLTAAGADRLDGGTAREDPEAVLHGATARFIAAPSLRGCAGQLFAIAFWTGVPWLGRLRQPTLVLVGDDDPIVPPVNGRILSRLIPDARLEVVPGGHLFLLERPAEMAAMISEFLSAPAVADAGPRRRRPAR